MCDVDEELASTFEQAGWQPVGVNRVAAADGVAPVAEFDCDLDTVDRDVGRAEDGVEVGMVGADEAAAGAGLAHQFPCLRFGPGACRGDRGGEQESAPQCNAVSALVLPGLVRSAARRAIVLGFVGAVASQ